MNVYYIHGYMYFMLHSPSFQYTGCMAFSCPQFDTASLHSLGNIGTAASSFDGLVHCVIRALLACQLRVFTLVPYACMLVQLPAPLHFVSYEILLQMQWTHIIVIS